MDDSSWLNYGTTYITVRERNIDTPCVLVSGEVKKRYGRKKDGGQFSRPEVCQLDIINTNSQLHQPPQNNGTEYIYHVEFIVYGIL